MGAFDDIEARSSGRYSNLLGRGMGEAKRRIVLLIFLAFFLLLTVVAFRRQDTIKDVVNNSLHRTATAMSTKKPDPPADSKPAAQPSTKPESKSESTSEKTKTEGKSESKTDSKSDMKSEKPSKSKAGSVLKSPKLGNGDRTLEASSLAAIHNSTLGVGYTHAERSNWRLANEHFLV